MQSLKNNSKDLDQLLASQITDKSKKGFGYNVVPSPHPLILNRPTPLDLSYSGLEEFKEPEVNEYGPRDSSLKPTTGCDKESDNSKENTDDSLKQQQKTDSKTSSVKSPLKVDKDWKEKFFCPANHVREEEPKKARENNDAPIIEDWVSDDEPIPKVEKKTVIPTATKKEFVKPEKPVRRSVRYAEMYRSQRPRGNQRNWNGQKSNQLGCNFVFNNKACFICGSFDHIQYCCPNQQRKRIVSGNSYNKKDNDYYSRTSHSSAHKHMAPRAVLMKTGLKSVNTARPVNTVRSVNTGRPFSTARSFNTVRPSYTAYPKSTNHCARPRTYFQNQAQSTAHRPFYKRTTLTNRCFNQMFNTGRTFKSTVNTVRARGFNAVKPSACWVWRPIKPNGASLVFNKYNYIDAQGRSNIFSTRSRLERNANLEGSYNWDASPNSVDAQIKTKMKLNDEDDAYRRVQQKKNGIFISQDKYVHEILRKFNYSDVKSASTLTDLEKPLVQDGDVADVNEHLYRYRLTASGQISFFCQCLICKVSSFLQIAYTDSDYAGATQDRKSTTEGYQFLGNRLISWQCKKQTVVATSTTEAEYVAAASCCGQSVGFLTTQQMVTSSPCLIDNKELASPGQTAPDMQRNQLQQHTRSYPVPSLSMKVFNNMKRPTKGFSGQEVALFPTMLHVPEPSPSPSRITSSPSHSPEHSPSPTHSPSPIHSPLPASSPTPEHITAAPTQPSPTQPSPTQPSPTHQSPRAEHHFPTPHDSPFHVVHLHGSEMRLNEVIEDDSFKQGRKLSDAEVQDKASTETKLFIQ
ncbi:hypothetical protein Tco_0073406 [Tanacetum coccineum]